MKTVVVGGLLGAGKTTFIGNYAGSVSGKTVVLVNDFGKAGIDGEILSSGGLDSIELPSGCVCCTLKFDLITTLKKITEELSPDNLLIEPSGIASPSGVTEVLDMLKIAPVTVVGIVDAAEFPGLYAEQVYGTFFRDQITTADLLLINKTDIAGRQEIAKTEAIIESLNPGAVVLKTVNAHISGPLPEVSKAGRKRAEGEVHFAFDSLSLKFRGVVGYSSFRGFFGDLAKGLYGDVVRAKALVMTEKGSFRFDAVYGKEESGPFASDIGESRLVVIGRDLKKEELASAAGMGNSEIL